jgi:hypothetical protein
MITLIELYLLALPFCAGSVDQPQCARWMSNDMVLEMYSNPGKSLDWYTEHSAERIPEEFWRVTDEQ